MIYKELPLLLQRQLTTYYQYRNKKGFEIEKMIIHTISPYLREVYIKKIFYHTVYPVIFLLLFNIIILRNYIT